MSRRLLRWIKQPPQILYALGFGRLYGRVVLLLTTIGRKSGYGLRRHPRMVGAIMRGEGLSPCPECAELERYAERRAVVILHPGPSRGERGE